MRFRVLTIAFLMIIFVCAGCGSQLKELLAERAASNLGWELGYGWGGFATLDTGGSTPGGQSPEPLNFSSNNKRLIPQSSRTAPTYTVSPTPISINAPTPLTDPHLPLGSGPYYIHGSISAGRTQEWWQPGPFSPPDYLPSTRLYVCAEDVYDLDQYLICYDRNPASGQWQFVWKRKLNHVFNMQELNYSPMNMATPSVIFPRFQEPTITDDRARMVCVALPESMGALLLCADSGSYGNSFNPTNNPGITDWFPPEPVYALDPEHPVAREEVLQFITPDIGLTNLALNPAYRSKHVFGSASLTSRDNVLSSVPDPKDPTYMRRYNERYMYYCGCRPEEPGVLYGVKAKFPELGPDPRFPFKWMDQHPPYFIVDNSAIDDPEQCWARKLTNIGDLGEQQYIIEEGNSTSTPVVVPREAESDAPFDVYIIVSDFFHWYGQTPAPAAVLAKFDGSGLTLPIAPDFGLLASSTAFDWYPLDSSGRPNLASPVYADLIEVGPRIFAPAPDGIRVYDPATFTGPGVPPRAIIRPTGWIPDPRYVPQWEITSQPAIYSGGGNNWVVYVETSVTDDQHWKLNAYLYDPTDEMGFTHPARSTAVYTGNVCRTQPYIESSDNGFTELWISDDLNTYHFFFNHTDTSWWSPITPALSLAVHATGSYETSSVSFPHYDTLGMIFTGQDGYIGARDGNIYPLLF